MGEEALKRGGVINFLPLKREDLFERGGLEDLWYVKAKT